MNGFEFCRKRAGMKQIEVADAMNVSQGTVCSWETGRTYPTGEKILALSNLYRCKIDDLFAGSDESPDSKQRLEEMEMRNFARKYGLEE